MGTRVDRWLGMDGPFTVGGTKDVAAAASASNVASSAQGIAGLVDLPRGWASSGHPAGLGSARTSTPQPAGAREVREDALCRQQRVEPRPLLLERA